MATLALAALSLVIIQARKTAVNNSVRTSADRDIEEALAKLQSLLSNPVTCNAILQGKSNTSDDLTSMPGMNFNSWTMIVGEGPKKARIIGMGYGTPTTSGINPAQSMGTNASPGMLNLLVYFEKNLGMNGSTMVTSTPKPYTLTAFVVTGIYSSSPTAHLTPNSTSTIIGCARSPASTIAY